MRALRCLASAGVPEESGLRGVVWRFLLDQLPADRAAWDAHLRKSRALYKDFLADLTHTPASLGLTGRNTLCYPNAALGTDLVGMDVGAPEDRIEPWIELRGRMRRAPPVRANVMTSAGARTAGVVRWLPDFDDGGHYVTFQLDGPKRQYGCFLETLLSDPEGVPTIFAGGAADAPCE